ncbi:aryl-alcohol dehydrogenase-like predicted oxidoreductase [Bacillus niacini]|uniref:Aryl-alcohol dehydrogenase-like predicted oxidoreductase n=1 Tax=Neobacillus niacini TaxID=86668 RepID=A0A852T6N0_9BACI|nr:aldo/keto reductase [Neobacillus niacini]NYE03851.1 aryl-alcohol dehydrogenase-like predicted oxidoreductase [Neobacillus niacini]
MEKVLLRNSDLNVSRLCFGGCPMGGYGWGEVSKSELINAVNQALDLGVNFFDTADVYGLGEGEQTLGKALGKHRNRAIIATKFGVRVKDGRTYYDNSPEWINLAVRESLKRLGTDYIDLYQLHYRDSKTPISEVIRVLESLKEQGLIRQYGLSNITKGDVNELKQHIGKFVSFQDEYSLATRINERDMFKLAQKLELTPITWGSLGQGILTGKYDQDIKFGPNDRRSRDIYINFHGEKLKNNLKIVEEIKKISSEIGKPIPAIAIRWILDYIPNSVVITGIKNKKQLESNANALGWELSKEYIESLDKISKEVVLI